MSAIVCVLAPAQARAEKVVIDDDTFVNLGVLVQSQVTFVEGGAPDGGVASDFFLRRGRLILSGQIDPKISFVFITDQANWGKNGDYASAFIVQDALASYKVRPELTISAGFMLLPFLRNNYQSASSLNTVDYRTPVIRFPTGRAFRDMGVEARGLVADGKIYYRAGVFNGIAGKAATMTTPEVNPSDAPRVTGTVRYNILGKEDAYAFPGIYFAKEPIVNVGIGGDVQPSALGSADPRRYLAYMADAFVEYPFDEDTEVLAQAAIIRYDDFAAGAGSDTALAWYVEGGYRWKWIEPVAAVEYFNPHAPGGRLITYRVGVNAWLAKHSYNVKAELALPQLEQLDGAPDVQNDLTGTLQVQSQF